MCLSIIPESVQNTSAGSRLTNGSLITLKGGSYAKGHSLPRSGTEARISTDRYV